MLRQVTILRYGSSVDAFEIGVIVFLALMGLTFVYVVAGLVWRIREGDIEPAGSDGNALTGKD